MMDPILNIIFGAQEACTLVLKELLKVLEQERTSLVALQINEISETTRMKESLHLQLIQKSKLLKKFVESHFNTLNEFEESLSERDLKYWKDLRNEFWNVQSDLKTICEINQGFLKASLRNLGSLTEHLRRLFGEQPLYSKKGTKVEKTSQGRVLEARY